MGQIDFTKFFNKKQASIEKISDIKQQSIEFSNALNNAVLLHTTLLAYPELKVEAVLSDIMDLVKFFKLMKVELEEELKSTPTCDDPECACNQPVAKEYPATFPTPPAPTQQPTTRVKENLPQDPCSEMQLKKIFAMGRNLGYIDKSNSETKLNEMIRQLIRMDLKSKKDLTKKEASRVIEELVRIEKER